MTFSDLQLSDGVLRAISDAGYTTPTPIQEQAIPIILMGRDLVGCAQTGTGKTASFTLPMLDVLDAGRAKARMPRSLILEPTRELAAQVAEAFDTYGKYHTLTHALIIGGESMADQLRILDRGVDVLIATPGRLIDVFDRGRLLLNDVRILVIDEADRMLDMGFIPDVERIISMVSRNRQTLLFSATMPPAIRRLADAFLSNPKEITVARPSSPAETVEQSLVVLADDSGQGGTSLHSAKRAALRRLLEIEEPRNALIFCNRKRDVGVVQRSLVRHGYGADMLHGDMAQSARMDVLERFKRGDVRLLVCSDVAARGLDIEDLSHVFNFDVPSNAEDYVHRIGRTGRAGRDGRSITIAMPEDGVLISDIEKLIGRAIDITAIDGIETGELERTPTRGRRRRSGARTSRPAAAAAPAASPRPAKQPAAARAKAPPAAQPRPRPQPRQRAEPERPVIGMGEHVPAFMLREVKVGKKSG